MSHYKIVANGNVYGRVAIDPMLGEAFAKKEAMKIIDMRKSHSGDKGNASPSSQLSYNIELDSADYPFSKI